MENIVLTIGGLIKSFTLYDFLFLIIGIILILLLIYIVYLIRLDDDKNIKNSSKGKKELKEIVNDIEANYEPKPINLSKYEQQMEDTAIISYDELVNRASNSIVYEDEYQRDDDLIVRKVSSDNIGNTKELVDLPKAILMNYENEEAFIKTLKRLQSNLVR